MAGSSFAAQVSDWARGEEQRMVDIFHMAAEMVANEVREPGPSVASTKAAIKKGLGSSGRGKNKLLVQGPVNRTGSGRMPVNIGRLQKSLAASPEAMPTLKASGEPDEGNDIKMVIDGTSLGETVYLGFQAAYALRMEYGFVGTDSLGRVYNQAGFGFVTAVAQRWTTHIVPEAEAKVRSRFESGPE